MFEGQTCPLRRAFTIYHEESRLSLLHIVEKARAYCLVRPSEASHSASWPGSGRIAPKNIASLAGISVNDTQSWSSDRPVTFLYMDHSSFSTSALTSILRSSRKIPTVTPI